MRDTHECTECAWTGARFELEEGRCPCCGAPATRISQYDWAAVTEYR